MQQKKPQTPGKYCNNNMDAIYRFKVPILTLGSVEDLVYDTKGNPLQVPSDQKGLFDIWNTADDRVVAVQKLKRKNPSANTDYLEHTVSRSQL